MINLLGFKEWIRAGIFVLLGTVGRYIPALVVILELPSVTNDYRSTSTKMGATGSLCIEQATGYLEAIRWSVVD